MNVKWMFKIADIELRRIYKVYMLLLGIVSIVQVMPVLYKIFNFRNEIDYVLQKENVSFSQALDKGLLSFRMPTDFVLYDYVMITIGVVFSFLLLYGFIIWYRDWYSNSKTIVSYFMMPISRMYVLWGKLIVMVSLGVSFLGFQLMLLFVQKMMIEWMIPTEGIINQNFTSFLFSSPVGLFIFSYHPLYFFTYGMLGVSGCLLLFSFVMFERSYGKVGLVFGAIYIAVTVAGFVYLLDYPLVFLPIRSFSKAMLFFCVSGICSYWINHYLLTKKVVI